MEIQRLLARTRLLTLTGSGGVGKTRLALEVGRRLEGKYSDGVWLVRLDALADQDLVPAAVASVLGIREQPGRSLLESLIDAIRSPHLLLVLDSCEQRVQACAEFADVLLQGCPRLQLLATSREALGLQGEVVWRVSPLSLPSTDTRDGLAESEAARLFIERARAVHRTFAVSSQNAPAIADVCRRLEGVPLAIELAAARMKVLSVEQLAQRLDERFRLLIGSSRTALPRQQTLRATIDWSYDLLSEPEQVLFRRLGVFAGGWTLRAAEAICDGVPVTSEEVLDRLTSLVDKSLVSVEERGGRPGPRPEDRSAEPRFSMLETVREYAHEQLVASGELKAIRRAHLDYYVRVAQAAERDQVGPEQRRVWERLSDEGDNIGAALRWCLDSGHTEPGLRIVGALWLFWQLNGRFTEGRDWAERLLALRNRAEPSAARFQALATAANLARASGDFEEARDRHIASLAMAEALSAPRLIAYARLGLGIVALDLGELVTAMELVGQSLNSFVELDDRWGQYVATYYIGEVAAHQREWSVSRERMEQALTQSRAMGSPWAIAHTLWSLGNIAMAQGDYRAARRAYQESLAIERENERAQGTAQVLTGMGWLALEEGTPTEAERLFREVLAYWTKIARKPRVAETLEGLACAAALSRQSELAQRLAGAADALWDAMQHRSAFVEREKVDRWLACTEQELGLPAAAAARAAGRAMTLSEVMAHVEAPAERVAV
jgi:non-specific serine/threonine protein kinase